MQVQLLEVKTNQGVVADIEKAVLTDLPLKKQGWQFNWRSLFKTEGAEFYRIARSGQPDIEGMLMLTLMNNEMLFMNNIEVAPHNLGSTGAFDNVAGCLFAFGCLKSFELGKNHYTGYLTFESKTALIPLYQKKYGATLAMGQKMFIAPDTGLALIKKYLNR